MFFSRNWNFVWTTWDHRHTNRIRRTSNSKWWTTITLLHEVCNNSVVPPFVAHYRQRAPFESRVCVRVCFYFVYVVLPLPRGTGADRRNASICAVCIILIRLQKRPGISLFFYLTHITYVGIIDDRGATVVVIVAAAGEFKNVCLSFWWYCWGLWGTDGPGPDYPLTREKHNWKFKFSPFKFLRAHI